MNKGFPDISKEAALNASEALSKLVGRPAAMELSAAPEVRAVSDIAAQIDPGENGVEVCLPVTGGVEGAAVLFLPMADAIGLADCLLKRKSGASEELSELALSALKEVGNIVTGAYMTVLSNASGIRLVEHAPVLKRDKFGTVLSELVRGIAEHAEQAVVVEVNFVFVQPPLKAYLIILLDLAGCEMVFGYVVCA